MICLVILVVVPTIPAMGHQEKVVPRSVRVAATLGASVYILTLQFRLPGFGFLLGDSGRQWVWQPSVNT
jgi:hypothetical protein